MITTMIDGLIHAKERKDYSQFEGAGQLHGAWLSALEIAKTNGAKPGHDPNEEMQAAARYINGELALMDSQLGSMKEFIKWCNKRIEYQEVHNLLVSMAWQIGLMIVTGEIAGAGLAAVRGIALAGEIAEDVRGASLLWRGAEVVAHAGLQTLANGATGGEISGSAFAENALGMLLSSAAMKPFRALLEGDAALEVDVEQQLSKLAKASKFVKAVGKLGAEVAVDLSSGVVGSGVAHAIVNNADMGITSRDAWMTQSLALTASAVVHAHTAPLHARITRAAEAMHAAKMQDIAGQLDALAARAEKLQTKSASKKAITPDEAGEMLAERHQILVQEHALYEKAGSGGLAAKSAAELKAAGTPVEAQLQLAGVSSVVDGLSYEGTGKQIESALKRLGDAVNASRDDKGLWTVTDAGRTLTVKEIDFKTSGKQETGHDPAASNTSGNAIESRAAHAVPGSEFAGMDPARKARPKLRVEQLREHADAAAIILNGSSGDRAFHTLGDGSVVITAPNQKPVRVTIELMPATSDVASHNYSAGNARAVIRVSETARASDLTRAIAHEFTEIQAVMQGAPTGDAAMQPGSTATEATHHDQGRATEIRILLYELDNEAQGNREGRLHDLVALVKHLGFDPHAIGSDRRAQALLGEDVVARVDEQLNKPRLDIKASDLQISKGEVSGSNWYCEATVRLPNGRDNQIMQAYVPVDANGHAVGKLQFNLNNEVRLDSRKQRIKVEGMGRLTDYAIREVRARYEKHFGRQPENIGGTLAFDNKAQFQRAYAKIVHEKPGIDVKVAEVEAIKATPFGDARATAGYDQFTVETTGTETIVIGDPPRLQEVPAHIDVDARRSR